MEDKMIRCMRCKGRKKMFKVRNIYSHTDTGGILVTCPMCNGEGRTKTLESAVKDIQDAKEERKTKKHNSRTEKNIRPSNDL